jgi:hypothetical protein
MMMHDRRSQDLDFFLKKTATLIPSLKTQTTTTTNKKPKKPTKNIASFCYLQQGAEAFLSRIDS